MTRIRRTMMAAGLALGVAAPLARAQAPGTTKAEITKQSVAFRSDGLALLGYVFKPKGVGPFPAVLWNHASPRSPAMDLITMESAAAVFRPAGYVLFTPVRRGHEGSEGVYLGDEERRTRETEGPQQANRLVVRKLETEQLDDQLAGLAYLRRLPFVDPSRIVVAGCSHGGIQALLGAERGGRYRAAISLSPAAMSWDRNPLLRERLLQAVRRIEIPVMVLQPPKDPSLEPSRVLGAEFRRLGKPFSEKIYPAEGSEDQQTHCFGGAKGTQIWAEDVLTFLNEALR